MKEAIITDIDGLYTGVTLVEDTVTGVFPINQVTPVVLDANGTVVTPESTTLIGYQVAIQVQEGLHLPKFDFINNVWIEGKVFNLTVELTDAQEAKKAELSAAVSTKITAGYLYPTAIASTGKTYLYGTEVIDQQNMTASRVWSDNNPTLAVKYRPSGGVGRITHTRDEFVSVSDAIFNRVNWYLDQVDIYTPQIYASNATADSVNAIVITIADPV